MSRHGLPCHNTQKSNNLECIVTPQCRDNEKVGMHWEVDPPKYEEMYQWPEGGSFLSPLSDDFMQKGKCTHDIF
ncbi:hypothetical protein PVK06_048330 [Gossypium arboreum]|uniref:Uncharacterized protein n=1 Tax=Gossypium arboreum TaxID=29729 RepID=A0ABR0MFP0_GOSAR|nr:hypothetical protein PVK06_048330 [Gossypium arboreum]